MSTIKEEICCDVVMVIDLRFQECEVDVCGNFDPKSKFIIYNLKWLLSRSKQHHLSSMAYFTIPQWVDDAVT